MSNFSKQIHASESRMVLKGALIRFGFSCPAVSYNCSMISLNANIGDINMKQNACSPHHSQPSPLVPSHVF